MNPKTKYKDIKTRLNITPDSSTVERTAVVLHCTIKCIVRGVQHSTRNGEALSSNLSQGIKSLFKSG